MKSADIKWCTAFLSCVWLLPSVRTDIYVYKRITHDDIAQFEDAPSKFGPSPPTEGLRGLLVYSSPELACSPVDGPPPNGPYNYGNWILLIKRGNCSFEVKVRNAQEAGYTAAIVHNVNSSDLEPMGPDDAPGINIPSVFIGSEDAVMIKHRYMWNSTYYVVIHDFPFDITIHMLLIFSVLVGLCFLGMVIFIVIKFFRDRRNRQRHRLPKSSLKHIPIHKFKKNDPFDTCVICLDDYAEGDKLRVLPCMHAYHVKCIDPWLTKNRRVCPVCKRKVTTSNEVASEVDSDSDEEARPLLQGAPSTSNSFLRVTVIRNERPSENAFQRARRHFLGLADSVASSIASSQNETNENTNRDSSSDDDDYSDAADRTSETGSLLREPSVNA